jgi:putative nucleotidyltransferase with HDIG domain
VVGLFFLSAALPTGVLALLTSRRVTTDLSAAAQERLTRESKTIGLVLLDRLTVVRDLVALWSREIDPATSLSASQLESLGSSGIRWLAIRDQSGRWQALAGAPRLVVEPTGAAAASIPPPSRAALARLAEGRSWLAGASATEMILAHRLAAMPGSILFAGIDGARVWGVDGSNDLGRDGAALCVRGADGTPLHAEPEGGCQPSAAAGADLAGSWTAFLGYEFGAPSWQVTVGEPTAVALAPVASFGSSFAWSAILMLAVVVVLANVQIRRSMVPLDALVDGTRRLSAGELAHRVEISSGDEFGTLATSFNGMAESLDRHVALLTALQGINQTALASPKSEAVIGAIFDACRRTCADASPIFASPGRQSGRTWGAWSPISGFGSSHLRFRPAAAALEALFAPGFDRRSLPPGLVDGLPVADHRVVAPIQKAEHRFGFLVLARSSRPFDAEEIDRLRSVADQAAIALTNARLVEQLDDLSWGAIKALARTIDANSPWTAGHSERVTAIAMRIGQSLGLTAAELDVIHRGGLLHDIGKIGVPAAILDKPGRLTPEERAVIERHPVIGVEILSPVPAFAAALPLVRWHHERLDGSGYPDRLAGEQIPLAVRILAVADIWDALVSERPYRQAWQVAKALDHLHEHSGKQFDPRVVTAWSGLVRADLAAALPGGAAPLPLDLGPPVRDPGLLAEADDDPGGHQVAQQAHQVRLGQRHRSAGWNEEIGAGQVPDGGGEQGRAIAAQPDRSGDRPEEGHEGQRVAEHRIERQPEKDRSTDEASAAKYFVTPKPFGGNQETSSSKFDGGSPRSSLSERGREPHHQRDRRDETGLEDHRNLGPSNRL